MLFIARTAVLCALLTAAAADVALLQAEYAELAGDSAIKTLTAFMRVPFGPIRRSLLSFELGHVDILAPNALAFGPSMNAVNDLFYSQMIDTDRELDMIYAGMEGGEFFGYFSSLDMTYRAAGASTASQMSFDPYTLSNVNEAVDAGQARGVDGQFVAADCSAVAADNQFLVSGRACVDSDVRNYYTADRLGRSSVFTRWRTYDPRLRSWYISGKAAHAANSSVRLMWSDVYTFVDGAQGISSLGVITDPTDSSFKGLLAVDYKLATITKFLIEEYGHSNDLAVYVLERSSKFLLGTSTGSALVAEDNSQLTAMDSADSLIAASATALDKTGWSTNSLIYGRHKVQTRKLQDNAGLDWIVVLVQPIECDSNAFYNYTKQACVECPFMMSVNVDPATSALMPCVCDAGGFSVAEAKFTFCFGNDHLPRKEALGNPEYKHYTDDIEKGLQCSVCPPCVDCGGAPADLPAGVPLVREGYGVSPVSLDEYGGHAMHAHRPVDRMSRLRTQTNNVTDIVALQCPFDDSCLGERVDNVTGELAMFCADGYTGPLCAVCIDGYGHGSSGCEECKEFDPKVYFMLPAILLFLIVMVVIHRKHVVNLLPQGDNQDLMGVLVDVVEDDTPDADDDDVAAKPKDTSRGDAGDAGDGGEGDEENSTKRDTSKSAANDATVRARPGRLSALSILHSK